MAKPEHDVWVTIGGERGDFFESRCGTRRFPVRSIIPQPVLLPIGVRTCYLLAVEVVSDEALWTLAEALAERQGGTAVEVYRALEREGMPILAQDCSLTVYRSGLLIP